MFSEGPSVPAGLQSPELQMQLHTYLRGVMSDDPVQQNEHTMSVTCDALALPVHSVFLSDSCLARPKSSSFLLLNSFSLSLSPPPSPSPSPPPHLVSVVGTILIGRLALAIECCARTTGQGAAPERKPAGSFGHLFLGHQPPRRGVRWLGGDGRRGAADDAESESGC